MVQDFTQYSNASLTWLPEDGELADAMGTGDPVPSGRAGLSQPEVPEAGKNSGLSNPLPLPTFPCGLRKTDP